MLFYPMRAQLFFAFTFLYTQIILSALPVTHPHLSPAKETEFMCQTCIPPKVFSNKGNLLRHINATHFKKRPHWCKTCNKSFSRKYRLRQHKCSLPISKKYQCSICSQYLATSQGFNRHIRVAHNKPEYQCSFCKKEFRYKANLETHVTAVHKKQVTKSKSKQCPHCTKKYLYQSQLETHIKSCHQIACKQCKNVFVNKEKLKIHMKDKHPFLCIYCPKTCGTGRELKHHIKQVHEKVCDMCLSIFCSSKELSQHIQSAHPCPCGKKYKYLAYLNKHLASCEKRGVEKPYEFVKNPPTELQKSSRDPCLMLGLPLDTPWQLPPFVDE